MAEMSNFLEDALINATLRNTSYTSPAAVYVALHTADPTDAGTGAEVSGGSYAREAATFGAPSNGVSITTADVEFNQATANFGTVTHIAIWDSLTTGNMLYYTPLDSPKTIETGDIFKISAGNLTVTLA
jgi:hypothetical protein